jgi:hypothetical protein
LASQLPIKPDPMPLREALRGLRHFLRRGGETLRETVPTKAMPKPAADIADSVLREVEAFAKGVDRLASGLAKSVLGGAEHSTASLQELAADRKADVRFATAVYTALRAVVRRLGAPDIFISEAAARQVYSRMIATDQLASSAMVASRLTIDLITAKVIRGATAEDAARVPGGNLDAIAVFAVMLWLQSERSETENEAALMAATDLALAIAGDVSKACADRDVNRIAALYAEFAAHV